MATTIPPIPARWCGARCSKAATCRPRCLEPNGHVQWVGPGCHFIAYYIRGKELVNIVTQEDTDKWVAEGWSTRGDPDEMRAQLSLIPSRGSRRS